MCGPVDRSEHHSSARALVRCAVGLALFLTVAIRCNAELTPQDLVLVVNTRIPASRALAESYARLRKVPANRIVEIDIPAWGVGNPPEDIPFDAYEPTVAKPVRDFLTRTGLANSTKCLVTFYGVPLRIGRRQLTAAEQDELVALKSQLDQARQTVSSQVDSLEKLAAELDSSFKPQPGTEFPQLTARLQSAANVAFRSISQTKDAQSRQSVVSRLTPSLDTLLGHPRTVQLLAQPALAGVLPRPPVAGEVSAAKQALAKSETDTAQALGYVGDSAGRKRALEIVRSNLGSLGAAAVLSSQVDSFRIEESESALDNELALLWWHAYPRARWINNPLNWRNLAQPANAPRTLMVTRIDAPSELLARNLIKTSLDVEQKGLAGHVVLDARGMPSTNAYGQYDQTIRNLNQLLHDHTSLPVTFDDHDALIPAHSVKDPIALYCGWYSLRNYVPPGPFAPGAVGFHVASFELASLHGRSEHGWVHGLISDGVCATLGPVAEPYLHSFPPADEFFPLLLTGKLTLAEVYWRTNPDVSWMQSCIADPLYMPFKANPALKPEDLPKQLRVVFENRP